MKRIKFKHSILSSSSFSKVPSVFISDLANDAYFVIHFRKNFEVSGKVEALDSFEVLHFKLYIL